MENEERQSVSFDITGMTCAGCARNVERALNRIEEARYVSVNLATHKGLVVSDRPIPFEKIQAAVKGAGYGAVEESAAPDILERRYRQSRRNMTLALVLTLPLMVLMILHMAAVPIPYFHWLELILGAAVLVGPGRGTLKGAWIAVSHLHTNMDTLVSLGALTSLATTLLLLLGVKVLSFGVIAPMLLALHLVGRYVESRMRDRAAKSIRSLLSMKSDTANLVGTGETLTVPVESVRVGETILVRAGDRVPLDGLVVEGEGYSDESMVSGEPQPIHKKVEAAVIGGTVLTSGSLKVKVEKVGKDTFLSRMIALVEEAQSAKIPLQALADRITNYFVPVVFLLALLSGLGWYFFYDSLRPILTWAAGILPWVNVDMGNLSAAIFAFVASLVIACPCALGLATPMALVSASGIAAKKGLIIRNGEALSVSRNLDLLLLDKTGTITEGRPGVVETDLADDILAAAAAIEAHSNHPLAQAVVRYVKEKGLSKELPLTDVKETAGSGISARLEGRQFFIGKPRDVGAYRGVLERGHTVVEVRRDEEALGFMAVADAVKGDSEEAVARLKEMGIRTVMVTGDNRKTATAIARQVGIDDVRPEVRPEEKAAIVRDFQVEGHIVGMVGDGINDAAAIKNADLGVAIGTGTDLAIESGDIVIIRGELSRVIDAIAISRLTHRTIKQNLFWAFLYNVVAIPLAMLGLLHPLIAEIAMTFSSINVIINSSRIHKKA
jgi:Cu+-exporting ATPase